VRWPAAPILAVVLVATAAALAPGASAGAAPGDTAPSEVRFTQPAWSVDEGAGYAVVSVERTGLPVSAIDVDYSTAAGTATAGVDYTDAHGTLHFGVGTTVASFALNLVDDSVPETTETVTLRLDAVRGGDGRPGSPASLLIRDDDTRTAAAVTAPTTPPTGAAARSLARPAPETATATATPSGSSAVVVRRRPAAPAAAPATARPPTRFELRTRADDDSITDGSLGGTRVNPLLAILAGLLVARLSAEVWFRVRTLAS
jgi:hypothetical protein